MSIDPIIDELRRLLYLGSLYKKCDSNKGVTQKELNDKMKELKKYKVISDDCNLETFVKICKLKQYPEEGGKCYVKLNALINRLTSDKLVRYIINGSLDEILLGTLLLEFENVPVGLNLLEVCIEKKFNKNIIKILLEKLKVKDIKRLGNPISDIRSFTYPNQRFNISYDLFGQIYEDPINDTEPVLYDYEDILSIIKILNIEFNFSQINEIQRITFLKEHDIIVYVNKNVINFLSDLIKIMIERNTQIDVYQFGGFVGDLTDFFEETSLEIHESILEMIKTNYDKEYRELISKTLDIMSYYGFKNTFFLEALKNMNELSTYFDIEKYNHEYEENEYQRHHLDKENVHVKSTNKITNKYIKHLIPNVNKVRDVLNEQETKKYADDFINFVNEHNLNHNNITSEEVLLCKNAFYDYDDRLRGRDNTPPGEGVETCNIFIKIWEQASNLSIEEKKNFATRLLEELFSILNQREINEPVCSTGWATRLINSLYGSSIDLPISHDPDVTVIKQRINDYLRTVRETLDEEEQEQFDDSISLISDTGFKFVRDLLFDNLIQEMLEEFKNSDFTEIEIRSTFYKTVLSMFPYDD